MSLSYSHRQTLIILVVCVLGVLIAGYVAYGSSMSPRTTETPQISDISVTPQSEEAISTSTDWRKQFLTAGTSTITAKITKIDPSSVEPETLTGQFGKKFFEQYMYLKQNNLADDPTAVKALVEQTTQNLVDAAPTARMYDLREIKLSSATSVSAEYAYANIIGASFSAHMPKQDPGTIALQALEQEDKTKMKLVEAAAMSYTAMLKEVLSTSAPTSLSKYHLNLVNALSSMEFSAQGMTKVFNDPIQSVAALSIYEKSVGKLRDALLDLRFILTQDGVTFSSTDSAIIIFNMTD